MPAIQIAGSPMAHIGRAAAAQLSDQRAQMGVQNATLNTLARIKGMELQQQRYAAVRQQDAARAGQKRLSELRAANEEALKQARDLGIQFTPEDFAQMRESVHAAMPQAAARIDALFPESPENEGLRFSAYAEAYATAQRAQDMGSKQAQVSRLIERQEVSGQGLAEEDLLSLQVAAADPSVTAIEYQKLEAEKLNGVSEKSARRQRQELYAKRATAIIDDPGYVKMLEGLPDEERFEIEREMGDVAMGFHSDPQKVMDDVRIRVEGLGDRVGQLKQAAFMAGMVQGRREATRDLSFSFSRPPDDYADTLGAPPTAAQDAPAPSPTAAPQQELPRLQAAMDPRRPLDGMEVAARDAAVAAGVDITDRDALVEFLKQWTVKQREAWSAARPSGGGGGGGPLTLPDEMLP